MQINTPEEAEEFIRKHHLKLEEGKAYALFSCGCLMDDTELYTYIHYIKNEKKITARGCPVHKEKGLFLGRVKQCGCGALIFSEKGRVKSGFTCPKCRNSVRKRRRPKSKYENTELLDLKRIDCKFRSMCLDKYKSRYQVLPCKGCHDYIGGGIEADVARQGRFGLNKYDETEYGESGRLDSLSLYERTDEN